MSFFDEVDEPRTPPRTEVRRRRPSGTGRRPPPSQQSIQARRAVAAVVLLVVVILIALGVHSCQVSARNSALRNYTTDVSSVITDSHTTGAQLFQILATGPSASSALSVQNSIDGTLSAAKNQLKRAQGFSVPSQVKTANAKVQLALQMRVDALTDIAKEIQPALGHTASKDAVYSIAAELARLYSSDVVYKDYAAPEIASALHSVGIAVGGSNGEPISGLQFVPDVDWVTPTFVASELHVALSGTSSGKVSPGLHGHALNSVTVNGAQLTNGATLAASPPPTFTLNFTNGGVHNEFNVVCKVTVAGTSDTAQSTVSETFAGKNATCNVKLPTAPPTGTQTVVATIEKVPGETNLTNNTLSVPVTFQ